MVSKKPRKQRAFRYNAPMHIKRHFVSATLDKPLRKELNKRSLPVRKGDEVLVMRGEHKKKRGKILLVDLKKSKIYIEGVTIKKVSGREMQAPIDPSNVKIMKADLSDKKRRKFLERKSVKNVKT